LHMTCRSKKSGAKVQPLKMSL